MAAPIMNYGIPNNIPNIPQTPMGGVNPSVNPNNFLPNNQQGDQLNISNKQPKETQPKNVEPKQAEQPQPEKPEPKQPTNPIAAPFQTPQVINPPNVPMFKSPAVEAEKQEKNPPKSIIESVKNGLKSIISNPEKAILIASTVAIGGLLLKGKLSGIQDNMNVLKNVQELKSYIKELPDIGKNQIKRVNIKFPAEKYQACAEGATKKEFLDLTSKEIEELKASPERLKDIVQTINGTLEAVKRLPSQGKQEINILLGESARGSEKTLQSLLQKQGRIDEKSAEQLSNILKEVVKVESVKIKQGTVLSGISNPLPIKINSYNYLEIGKESGISSFCKWIAENFR